MRAGQVSAVAKEDLKRELPYLARRQRGPPAGCAVREAAVGHHTLVERPLFGRNEELELHGPAGGKVR